MIKNLAVVGAGAKAAAIAARVAVLRDAAPGTAPALHVFEQDHIGAAWSGEADYSSGFLKLCTAGEKDVGYPYLESIPRGGLSRPMSHILFERFSFSRFLVATGAFANWVERGRTFPSHRHFAHYLQWVFEQASQPVIAGCVTAIIPGKTGNWRIEYREGGVARTLEVDGVVLTGTGDAAAVKMAPGVDRMRVLDARNFWRLRGTVFEDLVNGSDKRVDAPRSIAVAGAGGAAGAIVAWLAEALEELEISIYSISSMGTLFPRGDGYAERRWFSNPAGWSELTETHRREIIRRTEAGVVSSHNKALIDRSEIIQYKPGHVTDVARLRKGLLLEVTYDQKAEFVPADYLVCAIGFDPWSSLKLVHDLQVDALLAQDAESERKALELAMNADLSLPVGAKLGPGLHVPALAALAHGPGMGNLGCLGLMAEAVVTPYVG